MHFTNKVVLITGAGSGIGRATALQFAKRGARVVINERIPDRGQETLALVKEVGGDGIVVQADVTRSVEVEKMVKTAMATFKRIDILVNNAGVIIPGSVDNLSEEDFDKAMLVNVKGVFLVAKHVIPEMRKAGGGVIVNIGSVAAFKGFPNRSVYCASKGAVVSLTKAMAMDYIKENIRVNCVCPGTIYTPALEERMKATPDPKAAMADFVARQPLGRLGTDEEIARAVLFAAWEEAAYMTGSAIVIDGGATL